MQVLQDALAQTANPWPLRRERAAELRARYPHAAEMLRLYEAILPIQEAAYLDHQNSRLNHQEIVELAIGQTMPSIIDATVSSGPATLRDGIVKVFVAGNLAGIVRGWLEGGSLDPFETYLARASASPLLEASSASAGVEGGGLLRTCPTCGGLPQLSYFALSGEALVTGPRYLLCSRCGYSWIFSRMTCAGCGEADSAKLPIYQEQDQFPHVRVDGCRSCGKYLLTLDLRRDARAVPIVDELAALPLDLYATSQGLTKITPNLMGN